MRTIFKVIAVCLVTGSLTSCGSAFSLSWQQGGGGKLEEPQSMAKVKEREPTQGGYLVVGSDAKGPFMYISDGPYPGLSNH